jgi:hypothetical protein
MPAREAGSILCLQWNPSSLIVQRFTIVAGTQLGCHEVAAAVYPPDTSEARPIQEHGINGSHPSHIFLPHSP